MLQSKDHLGTVDDFDLLMPLLGELVGSSAREHRYIELNKTMNLSENVMNNLDWYLDLRKWGSIRHGGFGLCFERLFAWLSATPNIREVTAFPRWKNHIRT